MGIMPWDKTHPGQDIRNGVSAVTAPVRAVSKHLVRRAVIGAVIGGVLFGFIGHLLNSALNADDSNLVGWITFGVVAGLLHPLIWWVIRLAYRIIAALGLPLRLVTVGGPKFRDPKLEAAARDNKLAAYEVQDARRPFDHGGRAPAGAVSTMAALVTSVALLALTTLLVSIGIGGLIGAAELVVLPVLIVAYHRGEFRRRIASQNEPYTSAPGKYGENAWKQIVSRGSALQIAVLLGLAAAAGAFALYLLGAQSLWGAVELVAITGFVYAAASAYYMADRYIARNRALYEKDQFWMDANDRAASVFGVRRNVIVETQSLRHDGDDIYLDPTPPAAKAAYEGLKARLVQFGIDQFMEAPDSTVARIHLMPATPEELAERAMLAQTRNMVRSKLDAPYPGTDSRPAQVWTLSPTFESKKMAALQELAAGEGYTVVRADLYSSTMTARLSPVNAAEAEVYARAAELLKINVWDLDMAFVWGDAEGGKRRIDQVLVLNAPVGGLTPEKRHDTWRAIISAMPDATNGWEIDDDQKTSRVVLRYGDELSLPLTVDGIEVLRLVDRTKWNVAIKGIGPKGEFVTADHLVNPHGLTAGMTRSGKSTYIRFAILLKILQGFRVAVFDGSKRAADLRSLKPWTTLWGTTRSEIANGWEVIKEESVRIFDLCIEHGVANWYDLPDEVIAEHDIRPWAIFSDEHEATIDVPTPNKALPKDSPMLEAQTREYQSAAMIDASAREVAVIGAARGIYIEFATQNPDKGTVGKLRNNLGCKTQLWSPALDQYTTRSFLGHHAESAFEMFDALSPFGPKGLAVSITDGGTPEVFRVPFVDKDAAVDLLEELGVERVSPWAITDVLELGMTREKDPADKRVPMAPPSQTTTAVDAVGTAGEEEVVPEEEEAVVPDTLAEVAAASEPEPPATRSRRKKIDLFSP